MTRTWWTAEGPRGVDAVERMVSSLDIVDQVDLLTGGGYWTTRPEPAIGLRSLVLSDGPVGVRGQRWDEHASVTLPSPTGWAATWDENLVARLAGLLAAEARRKRVDVLLGPTVNLQRSPLAGRHFECLSEDPLLTGRIGVAYVRGLQERGVAATAKHYVANDAETHRFTVDVRVDERTLREVYLAPFEDLVVDGGVWVVMAAYNQVNGATMTASPLLSEPLTGDWGFDGVVVSDWYATRSVAASALAGTGLVMPGPEGPWGEALVSAVRDGTVPAALVQDKVRRLLRLAVRVGALADSDPVALAEPTTGDAAALLREAAAAAMVLLRNHGDTLPLDRGSLRSVAVLGPNAAEPAVQGGGTAGVTPPYTITPVAGLRAALGEDVQVTHAAGAYHPPRLSPMPSSFATCPHCGEPGLAVRYIDPTGRERRAEHRNLGQLIWFGAEVVGGDTVEVSARFRAPQAGRWRLGFAGVGAFVLRVDGEVVFEDVVRADSGGFAASFLDPPQRFVTRDLGEDDELDLLLVHGLASEWEFAKLIVGVQAPRRPEDDEMAAAVDAARAADAAIVVVGTTEWTETEGRDRTSLRLPGRQDELVTAVAAVNPRTVVVVNAGAPVAMPWRDDVAAVLLAWFPGQEFGHALADVLLGDVEPGGRLPTTWAARDQDVPVLSTRPVDGRLAYVEGLHIGYRAWLRAGVAPAYPFGAGQGYTTWSYEAVDAPATTPPGQDVCLSVRVRNTGRRRGKEVVQVYLARPDSVIDRPRLCLAGFGLVRADPGEQAVTEIRLAARAFQHWSVADHAWRTEPGVFQLSVGRSVADRPLTCTVSVIA
jgi:beta-glucosidase